MKRDLHRRLPSEVVAAEGILDGIPIPIDRLRLAMALSMPSNLQLRALPQLSPLPALSAAFISPAPAAMLPTFLAPPSALRCLSALAPSACSLLRPRNGIVTRACCSGGDSSAQPPCPPFGASGAGGSRNFFFARRLIAFEIVAFRLRSLGFFLDFSGFYRVLLGVVVSWDGGWFLAMEGRSWCLISFVVSTDLWSFRSVIVELGCFASGNFDLYRC